MDKQNSSNIVIQDVQANNITIKIEGKEIKLESALNQWLVQFVMQAVVPFSETAKKFMQAVSKVDDWSNKQKYRNAALKVIQSSYIGVVGIYIKKLAAISISSDFTEQKTKSYVVNSYLLALRLLDFINAGLLSALWNFAEKNELHSDKKDFIQQYFNQVVDRDIDFSFNLFLELYSILKINNVELPFPELKSVEEYFQPESDLAIAIKGINTIYNKLAKQSITAEELFWIEKYTSDILTVFAFLAKYKIHSVKEVKYVHPRYWDEFFLHKYIFYGLSAKSAEQDKINEMKIVKSAQTVSTEAIFVLSVDNDKGFNIFPFFIDYNNVLLEEGTNLCVYSHRELEDNKCLNFISLADNKFLEIKTEKMSDISFEQIYADKENIIKHKKNIIYELLSRAEKKIIGENTEDDDFLENLLND